MYKLSSQSLEWAKIHLTNFFDSDFFPKLFEFDAINADWVNVKKYLIDLDIFNYVPKNPSIFLALKNNMTYRVVHQLEPLDSLIYTALIYENADLIESKRIPEFRKIACSHRLKIENNGNFFNYSHKCYGDFISSAKLLSSNSVNGVVLVCDLVDFYNQIYLHRINSVLSEAGSKASKVIEKFLLGLNTKISRGIPVGPDPSNLIAEAVMSDIDAKILLHTDRFTRYVDDIYIFFDSQIEASLFLHEITQYLYSTHRLVFSSEKTKIISTTEFENVYLNENNKIERLRIRNKIQDLSEEYYSTVEEKDTFEDLSTSNKFLVRSETYFELFNEVIQMRTNKLGLIKHLLRKSGEYKIRSIIPLIFSNLEALLPLIREIVIYLNKVINKEVILSYEKEFKNLLINKYLENPYINLWVFTLFQNECFNCINLKIDYSKIIRIRERALIAKRENNLPWVKDFKNKIDTLSTMDKNAVIYASSILSNDELIHWIELQKSKSDILSNSICNYVKGNIQKY